MKNLTLFLLIFLGLCDSLFAQRESTNISFVASKGINTIRNSFKQGIYDTNTNLLYLSDMGFNNVININVGVEKIMANGLYIGADIGVGLEKFFLRLESQRESTEDVKLEIFNNNKELSNLTSFSFRTRVGYEFNHKNFSAILTGNIVGWNFITQIEDGEYSQFVEDINTEDISFTANIQYNGESIKWAVEPQLNIRWSMPKSNISLQGGGSFRHELSDVFSGYSSSENIYYSGNRLSNTTTGPVYVGNYGFNVGFLYSL